MQKLKLNDMIQNESAEKILESIVQNVFTLLKNNTEKDVQKFVVYLHNLYQMVNADLNVFIDKFLSTFDLVKVYSSEQEQKLKRKLQSVYFIKLILETKKTCRLFNNVY